MILATEIAENYSPGELISHEYLREMLNIPFIEIDGYKSTVEYSADFTSNQLAYMNAIEKLRKTLLKKHKYCLVSVNGKGYQIIHPRDQSKYGYDKTIKEISTSLKTGKNIMSNIRIRELSEEEIARGSDLLCKIGNIAYVFKSARK